MTNEPYNARESLQDLLRHLRHTIHHCEMKLEYSSEPIEPLIVAVETEIQQASRVMDKIRREAETDFVENVLPYIDAMKDLTNQILSRGALSDKEPF